MREPKAFLFDLDGVLTDTSYYHYLAWKEIANEMNLKFDQKYNERLKGVSRKRSFEIILEINNWKNVFTEDEIIRIIHRKNEIYCSMIQKITPKNVLPGVISLLKNSKEHGILLAVASASKNAQAVINRLELESYFDFIADASKIVNTKPDPEVFLVCAYNLGIKQSECIGFEDSQAGIEAIHTATMFSVGIGVTVTSVKPDYILKNTEELNFENIVKKYGEWNSK